MDTTQEVYIVTYSSPEIATLGEYLQSNDSPAFPSQITKGDSNGQDYRTITQNANGTQSETINWEKYAKEFCSYTDGTKDGQGNLITNYDKILKSIKQPPLYNQVKQKTIKYMDFPLRPSIKFVIPKANIDRIGLLTQGIEVVSNDEGAFKAKALYDLEKDQKYYPINKLIQQNPDSSAGNLKKMYPDLTVWIWCRALSNDVKDGTLEGSFFDISPFIHEITISNGKNGGNFQLSLAPIIAEQNSKDGRWEIKTASFTNSEDETAFLASVSTDKLVTSLGQTKSVRNNFLFHNILSSNDVVFIRFETLSLEEKQRVQDLSKGQFYIDKYDVPGRIYDMIGLVDRNSISIAMEDRDISIKVEGRDLSKLFIEDGTYFYALENKQGTLNFAGGSDAKNDLTKRLISDNTIPYLGLYFNNSIENVLKFVIQQLSTIAVVPDDLFIGYGVNEQITTVTDAKNNQIAAIKSFVPAEIDRRNTTYGTTNSEKEDQAIYLKNIASQTASAQLLITSQRKANGANIYQGKTVPASSEPYFANSIFSLLEQFVSDLYDAKALIITGNSVSGWNTFVQKDDAGNPLNTIQANTFPTNLTDYQTQLFPDTSTLSRSSDTVGVVDAIYQIVQQQKNRESYTPTDASGLAKGIWQIVKLVIDKQVTNRRICDASISSANGSLLNFIRKVCQEPFVEFMMDTYKDQYYLIVRKPPYDREAMIDMITGGCYTESNLNSATPGIQTQAQINAQQDVQDDYYSKGVAVNAVIGIDAIDVLNENFVFDDNEVYSWYHFTPQGNFFGNAENFSLSYVPALNFPEYADIWGSKPLDIVNNYLPYLPLDKKSNGLDYFSKQAFYDLKYLVESHQYLPFTRKGTISINRDRRIKVGNPIRYNPTGEIFWVDSVTHTHTNSNGNIDAITTIQVSRGMIEAFIYGVLGKDLGDTVNPNLIYSYFTIINTTLDFSKFKTIPLYKTITEQVPVTRDTYGNVITDSSNTIPLVPGDPAVQPEMYSSPITAAWTPSDKCYSELESSEKLSLVAYYDVNGFAIGYGSHYYENGAPVQNGDTISSARATTLLKKLVVKTYLPTVLKSFPSLSFNQNELDALVHMVYNTGSIPTSKVNNTSLSKLIYGYKRGTVTGEQLKNVWIQTRVHIGTTKTPDPELVSRRTLEANWFLTGYTPANDGTTEILETMETEKQVPNGFETVVDETQVLNNFKVNKTIFNYFLRKQHFDYKDTGYTNNKLDTVIIAQNNTPLPGASTNNNLV